MLGLANRYDGMDLPGDACRIVVLDGKPDAVSLQEKFLSERAEASAALSERLRTRIVQGAGRCTRGPNDYAVVVVSGSDITRYFSRPENQTALEPELQAEVQFGWDNSKGKDASDILENVRIFLDHDAEWREGGEPLVAEFREEATGSTRRAPRRLASPPSSRSKPGSWRSARTGSRRVRSSRKPPAWSAREAKRRGGIAVCCCTSQASGFISARRVKPIGPMLGSWSAMQRRRRSRGTWLKEMKELPGADAVPLAAADAVAVNTIVARLTGKLKANKIKEELAEMREALDQESDSVEAALSTMGAFLGAEAAKPAGQGRCDSAWRWDTALWMTLEAKSEEHADGLLPLKDIRQANTQLDHLATDQGVGPRPGGKSDDHRVGSSGGRSRPRPWQTRTSTWRRPTL